MQLFISLQSHPETDMAENQQDIPTLAANGMLLSGTKLNILGCTGAHTGKLVGCKECEYDHDGRPSG